MDSPELLQNGSKISKTGAILPVCNECSYAKEPIRQDKNKNTYNNQNIKSKLIGLSENNLAILLKFKENTLLRLDFIRVDYR